jgi:hypothetical protein
MSLGDLGEVERQVVLLRRAGEALVLPAGSLCGTSTVRGTLIPSRMSAQYAACFSMDWNVNG